MVTARLRAHDAARGSELAAGLYIRVAGVNACRSRCTPTWRQCGAGASSRPGCSTLAYRPGGQGVAGRRLLAVLEALPEQLVVADQQAHVERPVLVPDRVVDLDALRLVRRFDRRHRARRLLLERRDEVRLRAALRRREPGARPAAGDADRAPPVGAPEQFLPVLGLLEAEVQVVDDLGPEVHVVGDLPRGPVEVVVVEQRAVPDQAAARLLTCRR